MTGKRKIGTVLDAGLVRDAKATAALEGIPFSVLLEKAVRAYLERRSLGRAAGAVAAGWAAIPADRALLQQVMEEEDSFLEA